jgi:hypothetical protein
MADRQVDVTISAIDRLTAPVEQMRASLAKLTAPVRSVASAVERLGGATGATALAGRFKQLGGSVSEVTGKVVSLLGSVAALSGVSLGAGLLAGGAVAKSFVTTNAEFEQFLTSLTTLTGSSEKAKEAMGWVSEFATKTPYELSEVTSAFVKLRSYGVDARDGTLEKLGDMASSMAKPLDQAVEAFADAMTGEMERLKEFGIKSETKGDIVSMMFVDKDGRERVFQAAKKDTKAMQKALLAIVDAKGFAGGMAAQSLTFNGIVSNLKDSWSGFLRAIGDAGAFDFLKAKLSELLDRVNELSKNGTLQTWAKNISDALINLWVVAEAKIFSVDWGAAWDGFAASVSTAIDRINAFVDFVGGWENALLVVVGVMNAGLIASLVGLGVQLAAMLPAIIGFAATLTGTLVSALVAVSSAILLNPIGLAITAIVVAVGALAYAIYAHWEPLSAFVSQLWTDITGYFETALSWFDGLDLGSAGTRIVSSLLDGIRSAWAGLMNWVSGAVGKLGNMLPGFVRDQLGISTIAPDAGADAGPIAPAPKPAERARPVFAPATTSAAASLASAASPAAFEPPARMAETLAGAKVPNVWDIVSGDAVPSRAASAPSGSPQITAPVSITVNASGVTDIEAIEKLVQEAADSALREWTQRQENAKYGLLAD